MAMVKGLAAAALLALSVSAAAACDDYADEVAMAAAQTARLAQSPIPQQVESSAQIAAPIPSPSEPAGVAAVEPKPVPTQTTENSAATLSR